MYDPKVSAFLEMLEQPSCGTPQDMDADHAFRVTADLLNNRAAVCDRLGEIISAQTCQAQSTAELLARLLREQGLM